MCDDRGWIRTLMEEAENERMHLMTFIEVARPTLFERLVVLGVQWAFYLAFFALYLVSPRTAHRKHRERINPALFDRWLALWGETARELMAPEAAPALEAKAARIAESLQLALFFRLDDQPVCRSAMR